MSKCSTLTLLQRHSQQHQHPIKLPINFYKYSSRHSGSIDKDDYSGQYQYIYPLDVVIQIMNSSEFYNSLPKNIIINHLLTTTNISIIIETLTILSQQLSKLVKSTLDSVQDKKVTQYISTLVSGCLENYEIYGSNGSNNTINHQQVPKKQVEGLLIQKDLVQKKKQSFANKDILNTQSEIQTIRIDSDFDLSKQELTPSNNQSSFQRKLTKKQSIIANLLKKQDLSQQDPKSVAKNLKTLFIEDQMLRPLWLIDEEDDQLSQTDRFSSQLVALQKALARKPEQFRQCEYCRNYRSYLIESTGLSYFDIQQISRIPSDLYKVLKRIKNVINAFTLYLKQTNRTTISANINVVNKILASIQLVITEDIWENDDINPSIKKKSNDYLKQNKKTHKLINQLQPYFNQVYNYKSHDSNQFTIDQLLRLCLKASELKDIQKTLADKYMNQTRLKKQGKYIQTFCITKQNLSKHNPLQNNKSFIDVTDNTTKNINFQPVLDEIQLMREYQKQQTIINRALINSKPIYTQINKKYQEQSTMEIQIKKHKIILNQKNEKKELQKSQFIKQSKKNHEVRENQKFKMVMYQQFLRSQGFNVTKNNITAIINQNMSKGCKSMNFIGKNLQNSVDLQTKEQFNDFCQANVSKIARNSENIVSSGQLKYIQDENANYEKKQTELYNKMLLNGQVIRNQISNEVQYGAAIVYDSMEDFLKKLSELNDQDEQQETEKEIEENFQNQKLFLTMYGSNMRKTTPMMRKSPQNQESLRNSRKTDFLNAKKTPKSNFATKFSSLQNTKGVRFSTKDKISLLEDTTNKRTHGIQKFSEQNKQTSQQVSIKEIKFNQWTDDIQIKKPEWLSNFITPSVPQRTAKINSSKSQNFLSNQRFKQFQQKNFLKQCLDAQKLGFIKTDGQIEDSFEKNISQKRQTKECKTMTNLKRPMSANCTSPKSAMATIKSLGKTLSGKRRSLMLSKEFEIENNSLLSKIYKQNIQSGPINNAKRQLKEQKTFEDLKKKIQKGKFTVDKFLK